MSGPYRLNDYSVPTAYGHRDALVRGYVHEVVISCGAELIARHQRSVGGKRLHACGDGGDRRVREAGVAHVG